MPSRTILFKIWGVAIVTLGAWYVMGWVNTESGTREKFPLFVGFFCLAMGLVVLTLPARFFQKRKDN